MFHYHCLPILTSTAVKASSEGETGGGRVPPHVADVIHVKVTVMIGLSLKYSNRAVRQHSYIHSIIGHALYN